MIEKRLLLSSVSLLLLLLTAGCDLKTSVDYDRSADFSAVKTYAWADQENPKISDLDHRRIVSAIDAQLAKEGLTQVESNPDVYVTYFADDNEQTVIDTTHYGYGFPGDWYWGYGGMGMSTSTSRVRTYTEGTLVVDIYKAKEKELVWRGTVSGTVSENPQKNVKKINKGLAKLFEKYPPPSA